MMVMEVQKKKDDGDGPDQWTMSTFESQTRQSQKKKKTLHRHRTGMAQTNEPADLYLTILQVI
jgi:hypothetical protein